MRLRKVYFCIEALPLRSQTSMRRQQIQKLSGDYNSPLINRFKEYCLFKNDVTEQVLIEYLNDPRFSKMLQRKISLQYHPFPKIVLKINWKEFQRAGNLSSQRSKGKPIGRIRMENDKTTIDLDSSSEIQIVDGQSSYYSRSGMDRLAQLLSIIRSSFAYKLQLMDDHRQMLLKQLVQISFVDLNILNISYCNLSTLHPLSYINAYNLRVINFQYNQIVDISILRRIETNKLRYIHSINFEPEGCPFHQIFYLSAHFPIISSQLLKDKYESAFYKKLPIWREVVRKRMRLFDAMSSQNKIKKRRF